MKLDFEIPDNILSNDEIEKLKSTLNIREDIELNGIVLAALTEYKEMLLGKSLPTRADEIKQHRLFYLIKLHFKSRIPTESEVSRMFQLTESESKSLIKNIRTRFRYQLEEEINKTLLQIVNSCKVNNSTKKYETIIHSDNMLDELNQVITQINPSLEPIRKIANSSRKYELSKSTYEKLKEKYV